MSAQAKTSAESVPLVVIQALQFSLKSLANDLVTFKRLVKIIMKIGRDNYEIGLE